MEKQSVIPFFELCRLCLEHPGAQNIFDIVGLSINIFRCTGVQVKIIDDLFGFLINK